MRGNLLYGQSGGVTAVINQSAASAIQQARREAEVDQIFAAKNGILGVLGEQLYRCQQLDVAELSASPGAYFGSCRYKLPGLTHPDYARVMDRILSVLEAHNIRFFLYNGGNDSQDTLLKIAQYAEQQAYTLRCVGIPKTIDNDLPLTDCSPGFASAAKFLATATAEIASDLCASHLNSTKVFVLETMGRNTGWLAAATSLAGDVHPLFEPDIILVPEVVYEPQRLLRQCQNSIASKGYCLIVVAEGVVDQHRRHLVEEHDLDAFGHPQLGGVAPLIAEFVHVNLKVKTRWAMPDCMQRSARHLVSTTDVLHAQELAREAVRLALRGQSRIVTTVRRISDMPYEWDIGHVPIEQVANLEKPLPAEYLTDEGTRISEEAKMYIRPLLEGEEHPPFANGLPRYGICESPLIPQVLPSFD